MRSFVPPQKSSDRPIQYATPITTGYVRNEGGGFETGPLLDSESNS